MHSQTKHAQEVEPPRVFSVSDAARMLGVSRSHMYTLRSEGVIRFVKLLNRTVVPASEIERVLSSGDSASGEVA
ncbi:helix-turn-helix domain-containing protein [Roseibium aggregatum]|uniref:helix-turn-helix domain-containing protein n=1 Tax=Roseibium aggregatum TaxID=187304 RepID=UPI00058F6E15|nr:helix-turn-helix domain-containing protein [Roseibium aggregatum]